MAQLSLDLDNPASRPYFLWSEDTTVSELRQILADRDDDRRPAYFARLLREATIPEAWKFVTPQMVAEEWPRVAPHLGRRRGLWDYLLKLWKERGAL